MESLSKQASAVSVDPAIGISTASPLSFGQKNSYQVHWMRGMTINANTSTKVAVKVDETQETHALTKKGRQTASGKE